MERAWAVAARDARLPDAIVNYEPLFGPKQCWVLNGFDSFAGLEKANQRIAATKGLPDKLAKLLARDRGMVAAERVLALVLRPDLGRSVAVPWARARYQWIHTIQVRPGQEPAFEREMKRLVAAYDKAGVPNAMFTYQVLAGMTGPTYLVVNPLRSLAELDQFIAAQGKVMGALGEEGMQAALKAATEGYAWVDSVLLAVQPRASYVPGGWVKEAPELWKGALVIPETPAR